ncbi:MAG: vitamin B12 dependent methionine synthase [Chitinivibrionales bacterium]|nr:vitamin B12 dependent methionine synthase [Chitinivibrionales bacterium]
MEVLNEIPFAIDAEALMAQSLAAADSDDARELQRLVELAAEHGKPKAAYSVAFVEARDGDRVQLGDVWFASRTLVRNLESVERAFAFVATCGRELDEAFSAQGDMMAEFRWDLIKTCLLRAAEEHVREHLHRTYALDKTAIMRPGSGDASIWPIQQQRELFALIGDVPGGIGVTLTDSSLMLPDKSTSGLLFPTEKDFRSCELCHRERCPSRRARFNEQLWREIHDA